MRGWNRTDADKASAMLAEGYTDAEIGLAVNRTENAIRHWRRKRGITGERLRELTITRVVSEEPERAVYAPEESGEEDIEAVRARAMERTDFAKQKARAEGHATVRIMTDKPIAFSISSDWHVTPTGSCDLRGLYRYGSAVRDTPGAFAVGVGDMHDNPVKHIKQLLDVPMELRLVDDLLRHFGRKMLGFTSGNHDDWVKALAGCDSLKGLAAAQKIHYAPDELVWRVELVDPKSQETTARYVIATRHKYRRHSNLNWTHACWRWLEDRVGQWPQTPDGGTMVPDILAIGDNHVAAVEERHFENGPIWAARMGPWQTSSRFGRMLGFAGCPPTAPTFILYPHRAKPIDGYADYARALEVLTWERAMWADEQREAA